MFSSRPIGDKKTGESVGQGKEIPGEEKKHLKYMFMHLCICNM